MAVKVCMSHSHLIYKPSIAQMARHMQLSWIIGCILDVMVFDLSKFKHDHLLSLHTAKHMLKVINLL